MLSANYEKRVKGAFSRAACTYEKSANVQKEVAQNLVKYALQFYKDGHTLDIACGTGFVGDALNSSSLYQLDLSEKMCREASREGRNTITANAQSLPFKDKSFDTIFCSMSLQWFPDIAQFFHESHRVLKENGIIAVSFPTGNSLKNLRSVMRSVSPQNSYKALPNVEEIKNSAIKQQLTAAFVRIGNVAEEHQSFLKLARNLKETGAYAKENVGFLTRKQLTELAEIKPFVADWEIAYMVFTKE